jgi:hypothetical protein
MRDEEDRSIWQPKTAAALRREAYGIPTNLQKGLGGTMSFKTQTALRETARDFVVVSAFGFWAVVIGFVPVVAIRMLMA